MTTKGSHQKRHNMISKKRKQNRWKLTYYKQGKEFAILFPTKIKAQKVGYKTKADILKVEPYGTRKIISVNISPRRRKKK